MPLLKSQFDEFITVVAMFSSYVESNLTRMITRQHFRRRHQVIAGEVSQVPGACYL
jgi:hypothetical protein